MRAPTASRVRFRPGTAFAISPDGRSVVYQAAADSAVALWPRRLDADTAVRLPGTHHGPAEQTWPFWSSDSRSIAFFRQGQLHTMDLSSGVDRVIADEPDTRGGAWPPTGRFCSHAVWVPCIESAPPAARRCR
jgi:Tol biopolymer transport system component